MKSLRSPLLRPLALALSPLLLAAAPAHRETPRFEASSQVVAVEVPVNVTGRDGQPLRGLTAADFEVYDEGRRQTLSGFDVVDLDVLAPAAGPAAGRSEELPSPARRHFLLLFDLSFSTPTAVLKARLAARDFLLHALKPTDLAAVATYSLETGPRLVVTFTPDRAQLARGIDTLGQHRPGEAVPRFDPLHFVIASPLTALAEQSSSAEQGNGQSDLGGARSGADAALLDLLNAISKQADKMQKSYDTSQIKAYTRAMGDLAHALDSVKGRKHIVLFSEGFDSRLLLGRDVTDEGSRSETQEEQLNVERNFSYFVDNDNRFGSTAVQDAVKTMLEQFRRADCVIEAVDIGGLRTTSGIGSGNSVDEGAVRRSGQDALFYLANETGGELFKNTNDLRQQLGKVLDRTSVTYLLTFERSDLKADGGYHRLRVKANLPAGARISFRPGYFAPRPFRDLDPLEKNLLAGDGIAAAAPRHDLDLNLLATAFRAGEGLAYVPVIVEVGGKGLLASQPDKNGLGVEIYAYASDERGEMKDYFNQMVVLDLAKARSALAENGLKYYGHLELAPGRYRIRVLVRNRADGRTGVASMPVEVPAFASVRPELLPPLFFQRPGAWLLVRERPRDGGKPESVVYPFTVKGEPYVPAAKPALRPEQKAALCLVAYNLGPGDLRIGSQVLGADGRLLSGGQLSGVERTATGIAGVDKLLATFEPTGLPAGDYVLRVAVTDPRTGTQGASSVPFAVR